MESYYESDIFAFPPIWDEGFGLPPLEAMAAGTPIVTSRSGTVPETVINGSTGLIVEKNNVEELAQALLLLLEDGSAGKPWDGRAAAGYCDTSPGMRLPKACVRVMKASYAPGTRLRSPLATSRHEWVAQVSILRPGFLFADGTFRTPCNTGLVD